jgi:hypothetical protein
MCVRNIYENRPHRIVSVLLCVCVCAVEHTHSHNCKKTGSVKTPRTKEIGGCMWKNKASCKVCYMYTRAQKVGVLCALVYVYRLYTHACV